MPAAAPPLPDVPAADTAPLADRVEALLGQMTLDGKCAQLLHEAPAIDRLNVPEYNWWNEALHGVARAGIATVFPQAIGLAASFNPDLFRRIGECIALEGRAKHHAFVRQGSRRYYEGLTFWSPNINIFRDPRWGRGQETYGECPWLTTQLGVAFINGIQGDPEDHAADADGKQTRYLKAGACAKHYAVHSGPEGLRHEFDAKVSEQDLRSTYLPAFEACVRDAKVESIMGAYNAVNGEPCNVSERLMSILRDEWGFEGHFLSDCWAIRDLHQTYGLTTTDAESAAMAVKAGCDLNCGCTYVHLLDAAKQGLVTEADIDVCLRRLLRTRFRLGMFAPPANVPLTDTPYDVVDCEAHRRLNHEAAAQSMVLLKNDGLLPLNAGKLKRVLVTGPNANDDVCLLANYHGTPSSVTNPLRGLREKLEPRGVAVDYCHGCDRSGEDVETCVVHNFPAEARTYAERADVVVAVLGLNNQMEGEQGDTGNADAAGDRYDVVLPAIQLRFLKNLLDTGKPVVAVLVHGGPVSLLLEGEQLEDRCAAVVDAFYPGPRGGEVLADLLLGDLDFSGRLPMTYPKSAADLPPFEDYAMVGRTYRFPKPDVEPLWPFGHGLSYARFDFAPPRVERAAGGGWTVSGRVTNVSDRPGVAVCPLFVHFDDPAPGEPACELRAAARVPLASRATETVRFALPPDAVQTVDAHGNRRPPAAGWSVRIGADAAGGGGSPAGRASG